MDQRTAGHSGSQQLLDEERHPLCAITQHSGQPGIERVRVKATRPHLDDLGGGEGSEQEQVGGAAGVEAHRQVHGLRGAFVADRADSEHVGGGQMVREVLQRAQRLRVSPLKVLEQEGAAARARDALQRPNEGLGNHHGGAGRRRGAVDAPLGHDPAERGTEASEVGCVKAHCCRRSAEERLSHGAVRDGNLGRHAAPEQRLHRPRLSALRHGGEQPRLADAGGTGDEHHAAASTGRVVQRGVQLRQLGVPPDEHWTDDPGHGRRISGGLQRRRQAAWVPYPATSRLSMPVGGRRGVAGAQRSPLTAVRSTPARHERPQGRW